MTYFYVECDVKPWLDSSSDAVRHRADLLKAKSTDVWLLWLLIKVLRPTRHKIGHFGGSVNKRTMGKSVGQPSLSQLGLECSENRCRERLRLRERIVRCGLCESDCASSICSRIQWSDLGPETIKSVRHVKELPYSYGRGHRCQKLSEVGWKSGPVVFFWADLVELTQTSATETKHTWTICLSYESPPPPPLQPVLGRNLL